MGNCKNCEHSEYHKEFNGYRCNAFSTVLYILLDSDECKRYTPKEESTT